MKCTHIKYQNQGKTSVCIRYFTEIRMTSNFLDEERKEIIYLSTWHNFPNVTLFRMSENLKWALPFYYSLIYKLKTKNSNCPDGSENITFIEFLKNPVYTVYLNAFRCYDAEQSVGEVCCIIESYETILQKVLHWKLQVIFLRNCRENPVYRKGLKNLFAISHPCLQCWSLCLKCMIN